MGMVVNSKRYRKKQGIPITIVASIFSQDLGMSRVAEKFDLELQTEDQTNYQEEVTRDNLRSILSNPEMFKKIIVRNE